MSSFENKNKSTLSRWQVTSGVFLALCLGACVADSGESPSDDVSDFDVETGNRPKGPPDELAISAIEDPATESSDTPAEGVTVEFAACGRSGPNLQNQVIANVAFQGAAKQRSGSSPGCVAVGALQPTDDARYFCWTTGSDGFTWTYLQNMRTGVRGWTRDDLLRNNGSNRWCGF